MSKEIKEVNKKSFKVTAKEVWDKTKYPIMVGTVCVGGLAAYIYGFKKGATAGVVASFHTTIDWFDKINSDLKLREFYEEYAKAHPEEIVTIKF